MVAPPCPSIEDRLETMKIIAVVVFSVLCAGCWTEVRNGNEVWGCDERFGCADSGVRLVDGQPLPRGD